MASVPGLHIICKPALTWPLKEKNTIPNGLLQAIAQQTERQTVPTKVQPLHLHQRLHPHRFPPTPIPKADLPAHDKEGTAPAKYTYEIYGLDKQKADIYTDCPKPFL